MGIPDRLILLARAYINGWFKKRYPKEEPEDFFGEDDDGSESFSRKIPTPKLELFFKRLEIPLDSDLETVKKAWKTLMKQYHPDRFGREPEKVKIATRICQEITEAYLEIVKFLKSRGDD